VIAATATRMSLLALMFIMTVGPSSAQSANRAVNRLANTTMSGAMYGTRGSGTTTIAQNTAQTQSGSTSGVMMLPSVATSSVDINTCDMDFIGGKSRPSSGPSDSGGSGSSTGGVDTTGYPPAPGPDYQPMTQHGEFVGWYSPAEVALSQTDFPAALVSILKSDRYYGGITGAASILYEIGDISSPFAFDEAAAFLGK
jgi:hypothetical protein